MANPGSNLTVVVVDDHPMFRLGVVEALQAAGGIEIVGQGATADEAISITKAKLPEIVLLDLGIPGGGLDAARGIAELCPTAKIVILTASEDEDHLVEGLRIGAKAFVLKGVASDELVKIVRGVGRGEVYVTPSFAADLLMGRGDDRTNGSNADPLGELTARERDVLELVADALSNKEIAGRLSISVKTVKHHMTNILDKLQARNRVEAALIARNQKIGV